MFYETKHQMTGDYYKVETGRNHHFPLHIHRHFEYITVTKGEMEVIVDDTRYLLSAGDALLVFPNQMHALNTPVSSCHILCIFSPDIVKLFSVTTQGKIPRSNKFRPSSFILEQLKKTDPDILQIKGILYCICSEFNRIAQYRLTPKTQKNLLGTIFSYVEENYLSECSLKKLAKSISYDYAYLSKFFKRASGISFGNYVNAYRLGDACYLLKNSNSPIVSIAYDCGFQSLRSFNRNFKASFGITPQQYRES